MLQFTLKKNEIKNNNYFFDFKKPKMVHFEDDNLLQKRIKQADDVYSCEGGL